MKRPLAYITAAWLGGDSENAEMCIRDRHTGVRLPDGAYTWAMNYSQSNEDVEIEHASIKELNYQYSMPDVYKRQVRNSSLVE